MELISNPVELALKIKQRQGRIFVDPIISRIVIKIKGTDNIEYKNQENNYEAMWRNNGNYPNRGFIHMMSSTTDPFTQSLLLNEILKGVAAGFGTYLFKMGIDSVTAKIEDMKMKEAIKEKYKVIVTMDGSRIKVCELRLYQNEQ